MWSTRLSIPVLRHPFARWGLLLVWWVAGMASAATPGDQPQGVDTSHHNMEVDWTALYAGGVRFVFIKAKQPGLWISKLRQRRHRPRLDKTESEREHRVDDLGILVETCRKSYGITEGQVPHPGGEDRIVRSGATANEAVLERPDCRAVRRLGVEQAQQRSCDTVFQDAHANSAG
ncbi:MAG: hypothetical protein A2W72_14615 [Burkholderiales bacterium RIFCSPLOWO2_12_67_14]|nr:MAG: hypothetical protein A2W72_14615 [Burkholderiales bacterium RIFCSPLOWO2_12_67_14]